LHNAVRPVDTVGEWPRGPRGFDAGKKIKGRKRHIVTDTQGQLRDALAAFGRWTVEIIESSQIRRNHYGTRPLNHFRSGPAMSELPILGIIPAAGVSARLAPLPCSKELLPVGFFDTPNGPRPMPVCLYLLERLRIAGVDRAFLVLRSGKWDIPAYLGSGERFEMSLGYLLMNLAHGAAYSIDQAYPFAQRCLVALGFPDIIFNPPDAYAHLIARQRTTGADVVLGLFPTDQPQSVDMIDLAESGRIRRIDVKPSHSELAYTWALAVWAPTFTEFLHVHLARIDRCRAGQAEGPEREVHVGDVVQAAVETGMHVDSVVFAGGEALDIGTPGNLARAATRYGT